jgi:hypothetical protein
MTILPERDMIRRTPMILVWLWLSLLLNGSTALAQVERVWLTHRSNGPGKVVVNWTTKEPGDSIVHYGTTSAYGQTVRVDEATALHQVEISIPAKDTLYHYCVSTGLNRSPDATFKAYPSNELRIAVVANWHGRPDLAALLRDDVHLLLTAGDNIPGLWQRCGPGRADCFTPYGELIDAYPALFGSVPFMPALGNHDREIRPRGNRPPAEPVYDIEASAFRGFFPLPDDAWKWSFDVPGFDLRIVALDLNHIADQGTTWQTCHPFKKGSPQYQWYHDLMERSDRTFVVTLYNEKNSSVREQEGRSWHAMIRRGTLAISGFGHFAERAEVDGFPYLNTSLSGRGDRYPDPGSKFLASQDNYLVLKLVRGSGRVTVELKGLDGTVLDRMNYPGSAGKGE